MLRRHCLSTVCLHKCAFQKQMVMPYRRCVWLLQCHGTHCALPTVFILQLTFMLKYTQSSLTLTTKHDTTGSDSQDRCGFVDIKHRRINMKDDAIVPSYWSTPTWVNRLTPIFRARTNKFPCAETHSMAVNGDSRTTTRLFYFISV